VTAAEPKRVTSVLIVGVGGQGTILAGKVLARAVMLAGMDVKLSETHGMAQRGGSVVTQVRFGEKVWSPVVDPGEADVILAFEQLEALRWAHYLRPDGDIIVSTHAVNPMPVLMGTATYPTDIPASLRAHGGVLTLDAPGLAEEAGNARTSNIVLVGCLAKRLPLERELWSRALADSVKPQFLDVNARAFDLGWAAGEATQEAAQ
jgi:indolepyruvate ferredoxin oxidoreductase, beta subunit